MRFLPLFLALACLGVLAALDVVVRLRLRKIGEQSRPFQGGIFNHAKYLRLRKQYHWSGWPVYLIWTVWLASIVFMLLILLYNTVCFERNGDFSPIKITLFALADGLV